MARKFLTAVDLNKNELQNAAVQNLASAPGSPVKGQLYYNSTGGDDTLYWWNGSGWVAAKAGSGATLATTVTTQAVGDSAVVGVATSVAREDHKHGREAFAAPTATTTFGLSAVTGSAATLPRSDHTHGTPTHDAAAHSAIKLSDLAAPTAAVSFGSQRITTLGTPSAGTDATTKDYVDNLSAGLSWKEAARAGLTTNRALTGLTATDGVTPVANDRILLMGQTAPAENGLWLAQSGAWTRPTDYDAAGEAEGAAAFVLEGTLNGNKAFVSTTDAPITIGTTGTVWVQFGGGSAISAGAGLTGTTTFDVVAANGSLTVGADDIQVGYAGTGTTFGSAVTAARSDHNHDVSTGYTKMIAQDCAAATTTTVTHNFNSRDVVVAVYQNSSTWDEVDADIRHTSVNAVDVIFATAPAAAAYRIVVQGIDL